MRYSTIGLCVAAALLLGCCICNAAASLEQLPKIYFGGRWWQDGDGMKHSWGVGTLVVSFRGSSQLSIRMNSGYSGGMYYTCRIEEGSEVKLYHPNAEDYLTVSTDLDPLREYTVWCGRNNEASYGVTTVYGVALDAGAELLQATDPNADNSMLRMEIVGDSISAGFKVTATSSSESATVANQDVFLAYGSLLAEDFFHTSDYQVVAKSGEYPLAASSHFLSICQRFKPRMLTNCL